MLPVYLKIFDERLLFAQGTMEDLKSQPLYTVFSGQRAIYFCLIEGDERGKAWFRITHPSGKAEDDLFAMLNLKYRDGRTTVALDAGSGVLERIGDVTAEFNRMYRTGDHHGILGVDRACRDPEVFERACETMKLVFNEEKDIHIICDNAEHQLTAKVRPPPPPAPVPLRQAEEPATAQARKPPLSGLAMPIATLVFITLVMIGLACLVIMFLLMSGGEWPKIEITPAIHLLSRMTAAVIHG